MARARFILIAMSALLSSVAMLRAQDNSATSIVTFYSAGCHPCWKQILADQVAGSVMVPYRGPVFDGFDKFVKTITPNRFVTFRVNPGEHSFGLQEYWNLPRKRQDTDKEDLKIALEAGKHYFIRLSTTDSGVNIVRVLRPHLVPTTCQQAADEAHKSSLLPDKGVPANHLIDLDREPGFPSCSSSGNAR
jgi:hypothetical protein